MTNSALHGPMRMRLSYVRSGKKEELCKNNPLKQGDDWAAPLLQSVLIQFANYVAIMKLGKHANANYIVKITNYTSGLLHKSMTKSALRGRMWRLHPYSKCY